MTISEAPAPPATLRVVGTFSDKRFLGDDYLMPITTLFRDIPGQSGQAGLLVIKTAPGARRPAVRAEIAALLTRYPGNTLQTAAEYQRARAADLGDITHVLDLLTALVALTVAIATLGSANALTLSVAERTREFAVMRALGLTRRQLSAVIRAESVITFLLGALPGAAIGIGAGAALAAALTRDQTGVATVAAAFPQLAVALAAACLAALLAGIGPARHAGRVPISRATGE